MATGSTKKAKFLRYVLCIGMDVGFPSEIR